jgi:signal peptidase I
MRIEVQRASADEYYFNLTAEEAATIKQWSNVKVFQPVIRPVNELEPQIFPQDSRFQWNEDNFGPVIVPKKGWTVKLDSTTIPLYFRTISIYEGNKI